MIRQMRPGDYEQLLGFWSETAGMGLSDADRREGIERLLRRNEGLCFVYEDGGRIAGTILCGFDGRRGYIYHLAVRERYRRQGIGRRLVQRCLDRLREEGCTKCHLFVFGDNEPGISFWRETRWSKRDDLVVFSRSL